MKPEIADVLQIVKKFRDLNNKEKFLIHDEVPNDILDEKSQELSGIGWGSGEQTLAIIDNSMEGRRAVYITARGIYVFRTQEAIDEEAELLGDEVESEFVSWEQMSAPLDEETKGDIISSANEGSVTFLHDDDIYHSFIVTDDIGNAVGEFVIALRELCAGKSVCAKCGGTGECTCKKCHGEKTEPCSKCGGNGVLMCSKCDSEGQEECPDCLGRGYEIDKCPVCVSGEVRRTRWINCKYCHGTGRRPRNQWDINHNIPAKSCQYCDGRGQVEDVYWIQCPNCHGEYNRKGGPCKKCKGTGKVPCSVCNGTKNVKCKDCSGTGKVKCSSCGGKGATRCNDCQHDKTESADSFWG